MRALARSFALAAIAASFAGCGSKPTASDVPPPSAKPATDGGSARLDIKHATDPGAAKIDKTAKDITVEDLIAMKKPDGADLGESRIGPFEESTYRLKGTLKSVVHRKDGDFYLVVEGKTGADAVVEVPDPDLCKGSPLEDSIRQTRKDLDDKYHPGDTKKDVNEPVTIEGVGFYGWKSKQGAGGHGSNPRLMPGTGIKHG